MASTDSKHSPNISPRTVKNIFVRTDLEVSPDNSIEDKSPKAELDLSNLNKIESILKCSIKGMIIRVKDILFVISMIHNKHMRLMTPIILKLAYAVQVPDDLIDVLIQNKLSFKMGMEIIPLIDLYETSSLSVEDSSRIRNSIREIEQKVNKEILNDKEELKNLLRRLHEEAEKRVLTNLYEVAKFLTVNKIDRRDMIIKLVDIIMKILSEEHMI